MKMTTRGKPLTLMPDVEQNNDWQFENPIIAVDLETGTIIGKKLFRDGDTVSRAEEVRQILPPVEELGELLKTKSRKEIYKEYGLKPYELANAIQYYERNFDFVAPEPVKVPKADTVVEEPEREPELVGIAIELPEQKKECQCNKDTAMMEELADLREEVERLKKIAAAVQAFSYKHRHQIGAGHYSEWGVAD